MEERYDLRKLLEEIREDEAVEAAAPRTLSQPEIDARFRARRTQEENGDAAG